ncbi:MAG: gamma-glutamyl-gamma-aminobutyrate hydrolase family protein [Oligoflexia bacterium]|nr:gamma-glutamyl-gamma-aminobutyrate hydrolase family protein [Oligoflexia bacterium]
MLKILTYFIFWVIPCFSGVQFLEWSPQGYEYSYLILKKDGETKEEAVQRYIKNLKENKLLREYKGDLSDLPVLPSEIKLSLGFNNRGNVLALANHSGDMIASQDRARKMLIPFEQRKFKPLILPLGATLGFSPEERKETYKMIAENFDGLLAMGGDDIHPRFYGERNRYAYNLNAFRDKEELKLIKAYFEEGNGYFYGTCRGHQAGAVANGCKLFQDIEKELEISHPYRSVHKITKSTNSEDSFHRLFGDSPEVEVNSIHHQSVKVDEANTKLKAIARAKGQDIIELVEYSNGRGIGAQFHMELMPDSKHYNQFYDFIALKIQGAKEKRQKYFSRDGLHLSCVSRYGNLIK